MPASQPSSVPPDVSDDQPLPGAPVPVDNQPGHHPDHEQDRPETPGPWRVQTPGRFRFRWELPTLALGAPFGITPWTTWVELVDGELSIRYGPWSVRTTLTNVVGAEVTGPYHLLKIAGPPHVSLADGGLSMATSTREGVCIRFEHPVRGIDPVGIIRHRAVTVTVAEPEQLQRVLSLGRATSAAT